MSPRIALMAIMSAVFVAGTLDARAQGLGRSTPPPGHVKRAARSSTVTPTSTSPLTSRRVHTFASWLDTADVNAPGEAWMWVSSAYWRSRTLREINVPAMGLSVGVGPRAQVGVSVPYYFITDQSGFSSRGFGAVYVTSKFALTRSRRVNFSSSPTLEILNWSSNDISRINFLLPVSAQTYIGALRLYGTTGYASRGSAFGTGAMEWSVGNRLTLTTSFGQSYSVVSDPAGDALGISRHRTDASTGAYFSLGPTVVLFASVGRTFVPVNESSGRLAVSAGVTLNIARRGTNVPRTQ